MHALQLQLHFCQVISSTSDKASPNQHLYRLHRNGEEAVVYKARNHYAAEPRFVYFISDAPHLMKIRNNIHKSRPGGFRYLWVIIAHNNYFK